MPSTVIDHFSYDLDSSSLKITFISGNVYLYKNVPERIYKALKIAGSKGKYFNYFIKDKFDFKKIEEF